MDRFVWVTGGIQFNEAIFYTKNAVRIYDGDDKTSYDDGTVKVTTHRIIWTDAKYQIALPMELVVYSEKHSGGFGKSPKVSVHLQAPPVNKVPGPVSRSQNSFIKFSFKDGGESEFHNQLQAAIQKQGWVQQSISSSSSSLKSAPMGTRTRAAGIVGIERKIEEKQKKTDQNISVAFQDLTKLMEKAKEMVALSSNIATKIKDKKGDITDDETVKFKSYLLSLGIPNPVTKETHGSGTHYHMQLAHEVCKSLDKAVGECGGMMLLSDAYCRINRARGMELLSPEDLLNACKMLDNLNLSLKLRTFATGVAVLQLQSHSDDLIIEQTTQLVEESTSLSAQELANLVNISVLLAKERLLLTESVGGVCRDDSDEGLRFFPNLFLTKVV
ncbi:vacuolar protein-sorting-associated protein 36-like [Clavelina lepadiformis]|uniref:Vacuolar protein-sorting-associated protein 36 n=1 Tax=Clavelina lepadiformis TaxID=159417 RepID=A0ABP0EY10_CLALP